MILARCHSVRVWSVVLLVLGCGGGGTSPPGPPTNLVTSGGDGQNWYFNNPLPTPLSATVLDANGRAVPGVVVTWAVTQGGGGVTPAQSSEPRRVRPRCVYARCVATRPREVRAINPSCNM